MKRLFVYILLSTVYLEAQQQQKPGEAHVAPAPRAMPKAVEERAIRSQPERQEIQHAEEKGQVIVPKEIPARIQSFMQQQPAPQINRGVGKPATMVKKVQVPPTVHNQIIKRNPQVQTWFNNQFFTRHRVFPPFFNQNSFWWRRNNWAYFNNFFGWGWGYPVYYDGSGPIVITPPPVYNQTIIYQQLPITQEERQASTPTAEWVPLGVFAVGLNATDVVNTTQFMQLAVNKEGTISGTYYNSSTDKVHPLGGAVDRQSQQAVWTVTDDSESPIFTTGLYNLTEDVVPIQANFSNGETQNWVMVPLNND